MVSSCKLAVFSSRARVVIISTWCKTPNGRSLPMSTSEPCVDLKDIVTIKDLRARFFDDLDLLMDHPDDFAAIYYWSIIVYHKKFIRNGLFDAASRPRYSVTLNTHGTSPMVMVVETPSRIVFTCRGTLRLKDVKQLVKVKKVVKTRARDPALEPIMDVLRDNVHHGVLGYLPYAYRLVKTKLLELASAPRGRRKQVCFYGHSLGGALSILLTYVCKKVHDIDAACYVMACPKVFRRKCVIEPLMKGRYKHIYSKGDPAVDHFMYSIVAPLSPNLGHLLFSNDAEANEALEPVGMVQNETLDPHRTFRKRSDVFGRPIVLMLTMNERIRICDRNKSMNYRENYREPFEFANAPAASAADRADAETKKGLRAEANGGPKRPRASTRRSDSNAGAS